MWCKSTKLIYNNHVYAENFLFRLFNRPEEGEEKKIKSRRPSAQNRQRFLRSEERRLSSLRQGFPYFIS